MPSKDILRYGFYYALVYVGVLGLLVVVGTIISLFYQFRPSDLSICALIGAALSTYFRFLKDKVRLPTSGEYWSLVATSSIIVLVVDFTLAALVIHFTRDYGFDGLAILIMVGLPLFKGVLGNMLFFRRGGFGKRTLQQIQAKQSRLGPSAAVPSKKMTFGDIGAFLVLYLTVYIPLYVVMRYASINFENRAELWLSPATTAAAAVCALAYIVRRLGRRPTLSEYGLLVLVSVISATVFEVVSEMAIYYYHFARMPNVQILLSYTTGLVIISTVIHAIVYSRPVAWLVGPKTRSA